jgi:hypothetical protein
MPRWNKVKQVRKSKILHYCLTCLKTILIGSSYFSKPYIPLEISSWLRHLGFRSEWWDEQYGLGLLYIQLSFCSKECLSKAKKASKDPLLWLKYKEVMKPILEEKFFSLKRLQEERGIDA